MTQQISSCHLFPISPKIKTESTQTHCCDQRLRIQKTQKRSVITLSIGKVHIHETVKKCEVCKTIYASKEPQQLVPQFCNFGFDVIVCVGKAMFQNHQTESEIVKDLWHKNVHISEREVSYLAKKFVCYLALSHQKKIPEIRQLLEDNGGSCLHFDGTNEGASPHLIVAVDEVEKLVLGCVKAASESTESVSSLLDQVKRSYGEPLAAVHDLGRANLAAMQQVFPSVPNYVCHFHFLRDLGKDLFEGENSRIRSVLQSYGVKGHLRALAKKLRPYVDIGLLQGPKNDKKSAQSLPAGMNELTENDLAYLLTEWILDFTEELSGYGFPFDREKLVFVQRMVKIRSLIPTQPPAGGYLEFLQQELDEVLGDVHLMKLVSILEKKARHFDQLRELLKIALPEGSDGLNDDGLYCDIEAMQKGVEKFIDSPEIQQEILRDKDYSKMSVQITKYWDKLFTKPISIKAKNGCTTVIQPQRTNNLMERFFREFNRASRKRTGGKSMGRILTTMLAETPLIKNLENNKYEKVILNGCTTLAERFAEIEAAQVRQKMKAAAESVAKLDPAIKKVIRSPRLPGRLMERYRLIVAEAMEIG